MPEYLKYIISKPYLLIIIPLVTFSLFLYSAAEAELQAKIGQNEIKASADQSGAKDVNPSPLAEDAALLSEVDGAVRPEQIKTTSSGSVLAASDISEEDRPAAEVVDDTADSSSMDESGLMPDTDVPLDDQLTLDIEIVEAPSIFPAQPTDNAIEGGGERIAVFPFDNFSIDDNAIYSVMPFIQQNVLAHGYSIVPEEELYAYICDKRVRETGSISKKLAGGLYDKFNLKGILIGSIVSFSVEDKLQFGLVARLINPIDGSIVWTDYFSAAGEDFITVLGLGEITDMNTLISEVTERLFETFTAEPVADDVESRYRVAVITPMNNTNYKDAGKIALQLFMVNLFKNSNFEPVEPGEVRQNIIDMRIRAKGELDYESIGELTKLLKADGFLLGDVRDYYNGSALGAPPKAALSARLVSSRNNRILWYDYGQMGGNDDIIVYDWRKLRSVDKVTNKIVTKFVREMEKIEWN